jgi:hypothetical protein
LTPEHRAVILLREVDGLSYEEISQVLDCPKGTVMSRLHYARRQLQSRLRDCADRHDHDLRDAASRIDGFVDGELSPSLAIDVARHLGQCAAATPPCSVCSRSAKRSPTRPARAVDQLDLSGVVGPGRPHHREGRRSQQEWRDRAAAKRGVLPRRARVGRGAAIAAGTALFMRPVADPMPSRNGGM